MRFCVVYILCVYYLMTFYKQYRKYYHLYRPMELNLQIPAPPPLENLISSIKPQISNEQPMKPLLSMSQSSMYDLIIYVSFSKIFQNISKNFEIFCFNS